MWSATRYSEGAGGRCKTQRHRAVVVTLPGLEQTSPTTVVNGTE